MISHFLNFTGRREEKDFQHINMVELDVFLSILIESGLTRQSKIWINNLYKDDCLFISPFFSTVMSRNREKEIMRYFRFDDKEERIKVQDQDKLAAV